MRIGRYLEMIHIGKNYHRCPNTSTMFRILILAFCIQLSILTIKRVIQPISFFSTSSIHLHSPWKFDQPRQQKDPSFFNFYALDTAKFRQVTGFY